MVEAHRFRVVAWWAAGRTGIARTGSAPNVIHFTSPPAFGGLDGRWTPEDMLLGALAACFTTTFHAVAEAARLDYIDLQVEVEATIKKAETGYAFTDVLLRPKLTLPQHGDEARALKLLQKAETLCLIARALSFKPSFEPRVRRNDVQATENLARPSNSNAGPEEEELR